MTGEMDKADVTRGALRTGCDPSRVQGRQRSRIRQTGVADMSARRKDPCAFLRTKFGGLSKGQVENVKACEARERDGSAAAITWLLQRYAPFAKFKPLRLDGSREGSHRILPVIESLPWNPTAAARLVRLELREHTYYYGQTKRGRGRGTFSHSSWDIVDTFTVPHWDYDGIDPLIAREPWERTQANLDLDNAAHYRRQDSDKSWEIAFAIQNIELAHSLVEEGSHFDLIELYARERLDGECQT